MWNVTFHNAIWHQDLWRSSERLCVFCQTNLATLSFVLHQGIRGSPIWQQQFSLRPIFLSTFSPIIVFSRSSSAEVFCHLIPPQGQVKWSQLSFSQIEITFSALTATDECFLGVLTSWWAVGCSWNHVLTSCWQAVNETCFFSHFFYGHKTHPVVDFHRTKMLNKDLETVPEIHHSLTRLSLIERLQMILGEGFKKPSNGKIPLRGGGVPPLSVNFFPLTFWPAVVL